MYKFTQVQSSPIHPIHPFRRAEVNNAAEKKASEEMEENPQCYSRA